MRGILSRHGRGVSALSREGFSLTVVERHTLYLERYLPQVKTISLHLIDIYHT
jgi:hypothetical protein